MVAEWFGPLVVAAVPLFADLMLMTKSSFEIRKLMGDLREKRAYRPLLKDEGLSKGADQRLAELHDLLDVSEPLVMRALVKLRRRQALQLLVISVAMSAIFAVVVLVLMAGGAVTGSAVEVLLLAAIFFAISVATLIHVRDRNALPGDLKRLLPLMLSRPEKFLPQMMVADFQSSRTQRLLVDEFTQVSSLVAALEAEALVKELARKREVLWEKLGQKILKVLTDAIVADCESGLREKKPDPLVDQSAWRRKNKVWLRQVFEENGAVDALAVCSEAFFDIDLVELWERKGRAGIVQVLRTEIPSLAR